MAYGRRRFSRKYRRKVSRSGYGPKRRRRFRRGRYNFAAHTHRPRYGLVKRGGSSSLYGRVSGTRPSFISKKSFYQQVPWRGRLDFQTPWNDSPFNRRARYWGQSYKDRVLSGVFNGVTAPARALARAGGRFAWNAAHALPGKDYIAAMLPSFVWNAAKANYYRNQ